MSAFNDAGEVAEWLRAAVLGALEACGSDPISTTYVAAGLVAWDDPCGTLTAAPERVYRTANFPTEGVDIVCENGTLAVDLVCLLIRCVPVLDDRGEPPTAEVMAERYAAILRDAAIVWRRMAGSLPEQCERANLNQTFVGAEGGAIGVETRMTLGLDQSNWCEACPPDEP